MAEHETEYGDLLDSVATAIYAGGDEPEWLTTEDGSANAGAYEHAYRALAALPRHDEWRVRCEHGVAGPFDDAGAARASADRSHCRDVTVERRTVTEVRIEQAWVVALRPASTGGEDRG